MKTIELSIVTSLYKSESFIEEFLEGLHVAIGQIETESYEIIVVNDGSPDRSAELVKSLMSRIPNIKLVQLSRNFGHHNAFMAGMTIASGEYVFNIDSDLETNPSELIRFWKSIHNSKADVIYGYQEKRRGTPLERITGQIFWKYLAILSKIDIPPNITTERIMSRRYVDELVKLKEYSPFLGGLMYWIGFKQEGIAIKRSKRPGKSSYRLKNRIELLIEAVTSFSGYPLRLVFNIGFLITIFSVLGLLYIVLRKLFFPESVLLGYTSVAALILFSLGMIMLALGIIGIYLEKVFLQSKGRPNYIIHSIEK
jgi:putative glycosyltransferase